MIMPHFFNNFVFLGPTNLPLVPPLPRRSLHVFEGLKRSRITLYALLNVFEVSLNRRRGLFVVCSYGVDALSKVRKYRNSMAYFRTELSSIGLADLRLAPLCSAKLMRHNRVNLNKWWINDII